jgi:MtN3 and saliva related transmembrane protein
MSTAIGLVAGFLTTGAWLPQLWQNWKSRSCHDISWGYLIAMTLGVSCWLAYGFVIDEPAVIATNVVTLGLVASLLLLKARMSGGFLEDVHAAG